MNKKYLILLFVIIFLLTVSACTTRTSDSGYSLKTVGNRIDSNIYILNVTMLGEALCTGSGRPDRRRPLGSHRCLRRALGHGTYYSGKL